MDERTKTETKIRKMNSFAIGFFLFTFQWQNCSIFDGNIQPRYQVISNYLYKSFKNSCYPERQDRQERGEEYYKEGTCQSESHSDGRLVRYPERTLRTSKDSGEDKIDRDHADLLRYPHSKCGQPCKTKVSPSSSCSLIFHAWNATLREWWLQT